MVIVLTVVDLDNVNTSGTEVIDVQKTATSADGKIITIVIDVYTDSSLDNPNRILKSNNYGASFTDVSDTVGFPSTGSEVLIEDHLLSGDGKYEIYFNARGISRYSDDYGQTFIDKNYQEVDWNPYGEISHNGEYFMLGNSSLGNPYSTDFGVSTSLSSVAGSNGRYVGVSNSGKFSLAGNDEGLNTLKYSSDFFSTFSSISAVTGVTGPFLLVDVE